jgi:putative endonuclease
MSVTRAGGLSQPFLDNTVAVWSVYLLQTRLGHYYCGVTTDIERRFREHQSGGIRCARNLRGKGPLVLKAVLVVGDKRRAMQLEARIKRLPRQRKEALIAGSVQWQSLLAD